MTSGTIDPILDLAIEIQQIPAPTFAEGPRAAFVEGMFRREGLVDIQKDRLGNIQARLPGAGDGRPLILAAHLDTVFPHETDLTVLRTAEEIHGPGIGDNALGIAGLFGLLWAIRHQDLRLPNDLIFVGTVGEEGLGNSQGMRAVVERFGEEALAYIAVEGMALGYIFNQGMAVRRYNIAYQARGGHSWMDFGAPSAIHELARLISRLTELEIAKTPRTSWNAGVIEGGTSVNTIASHASVQIDMRSEDEAALASLEADVIHAARTLPPPEVEVSLELIGDRPMGFIPGDHPLVRLARDSLEAVNIEPRLSVGSTDASIPLHFNLPAICIGLTTGSGTHSPDEMIHTPPLARGMEQLIRVVAGAHQALLGD